MQNQIYILVVDDNKENLKVVSNFLKKENYKIALALNGISALKVLDENKIDLILMDIMMPGMDGLEVCRLIKQSEKLKEIPIIFLTAKNQTEDLVEGFRAGAVDFITKPFNSEELLMRVKNHLELSNSKKTILEMIQTRDKLYSIIAHDIRSPFASITQTIEAISSGYIEVGSDDFTKIFKLLKKTTTETSILLNNLLEWTKLQSNSISISPGIINIYSLLDECIQLLNGNAQNKNISITLDIPVNTEAFCDETTIHTVFRNILSNAIKFTAEKGNIFINSETTPDFVKINIKDTGIGISKEKINNFLIKTNQNTHKDSKNDYNLGLGLLIIKDFIEQNHGKVTVESSHGKGTTFSVFLPANRL